MIITSAPNLRAQDIEVRVLQWLVQNLAKVKGRWPVTCSLCSAWPGSEPGVRCSPPKPAGPEPLYLGLGHGGTTFEEPVGGCPSAGGSWLLRGAGG